MTDEERLRKLIAARAKLGGPFITEILVNRVTPPSSRLKEIQEKAPKVSKVTHLMRKK